MTDRGIIYLVTGRAVYWPACLLSIRSLRRATCREPVRVVTDLSDDLWPDREELNYSVVRLGDLPRRLPRAGDAWSRKLHLYRYSPFDRTLFLDCDTIVRSPIDRLWECMEYAPFAIAYDRVPQVDLVRQTYPGFGKPEEWHETISLCGNAAPFYNTGVFAWTNGPVAERLFEAWYAEWAKYRSNEQAPLIRTLHRIGLIPVVLPQEFNAQVPGTPAYQHAVIRHFNWCRKLNLLDEMLRSEPDDVTAAVHLLTTPG